ncbi:efflux RND transporter permease subunit [bacterium]|nr:efflux RND transporter permease subunit [bacterium]
MIRWFTKNDIAANFLLAAILLGGIYTALNKVPLEVSPTEDFGQVDISMTYRGGSPQDVQEHIVLPIERVLRDLPGIKELQVEARRGSADFDIIPEDGIELEDLRDEVESLVDTINTFPGETERPRITVPNSSSYREVITVAVTGELSEMELYHLARRVEEDLLELPEVSRTDLRGTRPLEISIEANNEKLRDYGLTIADLSDAIRRSSLALSAGSVQTSTGPITIRTNGQAYEQEDFGNIVVTVADGAELRLSDLAIVKDGFEDQGQLTRFNGVRALMIDVLQGQDESAIEISDAIHRYIEGSEARYPAGIVLHTWDDESTRIRGRLATLGNSLMVGALLVFIVLGVFLRPMLAFWVVIGIPASFAGGVILMPYFGLTANTMSLFGFIIVLGIVVDDAIVTGENVYTRMRDDLTPLDAAVLGTKEVATPVTFGVITTVVAFIPLMFLEGHWSTYTKQIPPVVGAVLLFSLIESKLILPSHLKHLKMKRNTKKLGLFARFQKAIADGLERAVEKYYQPLLRTAVKYRYSTIAIFLTLGALAVGLKQGGKMGFVAFPSIERNVIFAEVEMQRNTPFEETDEQILYVSDKARELQRELIDPGTGKSLIINIYSSTAASGRGGRSTATDEGRVMLEIMPPGERSEPGPSNDDICKMWIDRVGDVRGMRSFRPRGSKGGRRSGGEETEALQIHLRGPSSEEKSELADEIALLFENHKDIEWSHADEQRGRVELSISLKPLAMELNLTQRDLASQIRQAFYGEEVQRIQRNGEEIRVMVRLPEDKRESLHTFDTLTIQAPDGTDIPFNTIADAELRRAAGEIERVDGAEVTDVIAGPTSNQIDIISLATELEPQISELVNRHSNISWVWQGFIKEDRETGNRVNWLFGGLMLVLYALLAIPFKSLLQPIVVLLAVPFGVIGAYGGHLIMGVTPSWLSVFGILALAGVVVNDSLVLVDFINKKREEGMKLLDAVLISGKKRFRPIFLTSITTFAGLIPLMFDRALHSQFLKPMAISLGYGILFATVITLFLIPAAYLILEDVKSLFQKGFQWYAKPFQEGDETNSRETRNSKKS